MGEWMTLVTKDDRVGMYYVFYFSVFLLFIARLFFQRKLPVIAVALRSGESSWVDLTSFFVAIPSSSYCCTSKSYSESAVLRQT